MESVSLPCTALRGFHVPADGPAAMACPRHRTQGATVHALPALSLTAPGVEGDRSQLRGTLLVAVNSALRASMQVRGGAIPEHEPSAVMLQHELELLVEQIHALDDHQMRAVAAGQGSSAADAEARVAARRVTRRALEGAWGAQLASLERPAPAGLQVHERAVVAAAFDAIDAALARPLVGQFGVQNEHLDVLEWRWRRALPGANGPTGAEWDEAQVRSLVEGGFFHEGATIGEGSSWWVPSRAGLVNAEEAARRLAWSADVRLRGQSDDWFEFVYSSGRRVGLI